MKRKIGVTFSMTLVLLGSAGAMTGQQGPEFLAAVLPVVGSTPGAFNSYFKTAVQVFNGGADPLQFRLVFHPAGRSGASTDPSMDVLVPFNQLVYFADMLPAMGIESGLGSLDVFVPVGGSADAIAVSRVFNDAGEAGTAGFTEGFVSADAFVRAGFVTFLLCPPDYSAYRFNIGVRTLDAGASIQVTIQDNAGHSTSVMKDYPPNFFEQVPLTTLLAGWPLSGNEILSFSVISGSAIVYGSTVDNRTNDASFQIMY